jgi:hypothetical protein
VAISPTAIIRILLNIEISPELKPFVVESPNRLRGKYHAIMEQQWLLRMAIDLIVQGRCTLGLRLDTPNPFH